MRTSRLEAFSDGVLAIIITIMVLELHVPHGPRLAALGDSATGFLTYALSFVYIGIYWNNHHHMFQVVEQIDRRRAVGQPAPAVLAVAASRSPPRGWTRPASRRSPTIAYGINLLLAAMAYYLLAAGDLPPAGRGSRLRAALGRDLKGKLSPVMYLTGIALAFVAPWLAVAVFVVARWSGWCPTGGSSASSPTQSQAVA